jgi:hypothetical protein
MINMNQGPVQKLIKAYFQQDAQYYSESKNALVAIAVMHPAHAANAAERLLSDAEWWAKEAGVNVRHARLWMIGTPLHRALTEQCGIQ